MSTATRAPKIPIRDDSTPARPPRPRLLPEAEMEAAALRAYQSRREIAEAWRDPEGRLIVRGVDGTAVVDCSEIPDATGEPREWKWHSTHSGRRPPKGVMERIGEFKPTAAEPLVEPDLSPWTLADLDAYAANVLVPFDVSHHDDWPEWVGDDPIKARAAWLGIARKIGESPAQAVLVSPAARHFRELIIRSGWLSAEAAAAL